MLFGYDTLTGGKLTCFKYEGIYQFPFWLLNMMFVCLILFCRSCLVGQFVGFWLSMEM